MDVFLPVYFLFGGFWKRLFVKDRNCLLSLEQVSVKLARSDGIGSVFLGGVVLGSSRRNGYHHLENRKCAENLQRKILMIEDVQNERKKKYVANLFFARYYIGEDNTILREDFFRTSPWLRKYKMDCIFRNGCATSLYCGQRRPPLSAT